MIAQKVLRCERRRQAARIPDLQVIIKETHMGGGGAQVVPVGDHMDPVGWLIKRALFYRSPSRWMRLFFPRAEWFLKKASLNR